MVRQEAYQTILKILRDTEFSDTLLHQRAKKLKGNQQNVALFYHLVKGVVKMRLKLDYILAQYTDPKKYEATDLK
ncbi:MAG TPA: 16S rRNA (cytosine(967)-C(5))-methyltransferase RsmB, partial [Candidatus Syntrophosphaera sp.]|nr:16S rRNA (cytosine(967)-C(5))-methyltransferase RsmB [Candidatus Syntrophosphaera sp.]